MRQVGASLQRARLDGAGAGGRERAIDLRVIEQLLDRAGYAVAVERIGVLIAGDDEARAGVQPAAAALVVVDVAAAPSRPQVVSGEADLIGVAQAVAILGAVEDRRGRMADEEVHDLAAHDQRDVPVRLGRQPDHVELLGRVEVAGGGRGRVVGQARARHVLPAEVLEGPHEALGDGVAGVDLHPELTGKEAEAEGVVGATDRAVVVEVKARRDAGVRRRRVAVAVVDRRSTVAPDGEVVVSEQAGGGARLVEIELVDEQHVGAHALDDLRHRAGLGVGGR